MAKVRIFKKDGKPTPYFWSNKSATDRSALTVYKQTSEGIKRMKGVTYDAARNTFNRD